MVESGVFEASDLDEKKQHLTPPGVILPEEITPDLLL